MDKNQKIRVGILFGGKSAEHEVSLQSAKNVLEAIDEEKYEVFLIGIDKSGKWLIPNKSQFLLNESDPKLVKLNKEGEESVTLIPNSAGEITNLSNPNSHTELDVVFPILHGPFGEDGTVQGLLKLSEIPFVGASVLGSAVGMDKDVMKRLLRDANIPIGKFLVFREVDKIDFDHTVAELGLPFFVKPANLGSSVGVNKVNDEESFKTAVSEAFEYDTKILAEEFIDGRELECAVLGNQYPEASGVGEVEPLQEFYSYSAKYIDEVGAKLTIPADIEEAKKEEIRELAIKTFKTLSCEGLGRVDFFMKKDGTLLVNEINTIPGFTKISMYPNLWAASGVSYSELISRLIDLAIERFAREKKLKNSN
ncbi:D-alanine--D-alanine ligase [Candidatus Nomurabacteria bacterium]|nr:D-alanine--D-alanine ligase [Candidatus Nomurabacteria bacterium]MCB9819545.1 D-alanine--D-alanine ligase [Candidatus Nomurabacteria bacterium]